MLLFMFDIAVQFDLESKSLFIQIDYSLIFRGNDDDFCLKMLDITSFTS
jgi:hypothetical protein